MTLYIITAYPVNRWERRIKKFLSAILENRSFLLGGIAMLWIWVVPGALMLALAWGLTRFLNRKYKHLRCPRRLKQTLRKALRCTGDAADVQALRASALTLTEHLLLLQRDLQHAPSLPVDEDGAPRILELAHDLADDGPCTTDALLQALKRWSDTATPCEVWLLPLAVGATQSQRLNRVLHAMLADAAQPARARKLLRRMHRSRNAAALLEKSELTAIGLAELAELLHAKAPNRLLPIWEEWLAAQELTSDALQEHALARRQHIAKELHRAAASFENLRQLNWLDACREGDPLHPLLLEDPSGVYPRMDAASQLALRRQVEALARRTDMDGVTIVRQVLRLAQSAEHSTPEAGICFWFQEAEGLQRLQRALSTKKGRLYARFALREAWLRYGFLCVFGVISGFLFLQSRGPVLMLPFLALVTGTISRWLLRFFPRRVLPRMEESLSPLRTLAVMPCVLRNPQEAIQMVRQLKTAAHTFPAEVDFLLLGDFPPAITPVTAGDQSICEAAACAADAMHDSRLMYLHRARAWDSAKHSYAARQGHIGALTAVCRLIAEGECEDSLVLSTMDTGSLERRYDYVLALRPDVQPAPDMYGHLLGTMIHPHSSRVPADKGWRGYAVLAPEEHAAFEGTGLIRPDAFLEATDGILPSHEGIAALAGELAGWTAVPGARVHCSSTTDAHSTQYAHALEGWRLLPWQLPLVQTPAGLVNNPLMYASRFRLRERLRRTLVPLGQGVLLLYGLLTESPLLIVLSLLPFVITHAPRRREDVLRLLGRVSLLPTTMLIPLQALYDALRRRSAPLPLNTLSMWAQGIAAALLTGLGIALPGLSLPMLAAGVIFACFPLAHRLLEAQPSSRRGVADEHRAQLEKTASTLWHDFDSITITGLQSGDGAFSQRELTAALMACISCKELGLISANAAAMRLSMLAEKLHSLLMPDTAAEMLHADAREVGLLLCTLMTAAQALRIWLPELSREYHGLSAGFEALASSIDTSRLYDSAAGLFCAALDEDGHPTGHIHYFTDEALLLSAAACARGLIPPSHFSTLRRTRIRCKRLELPMSAHGSASEHLLPSLFLPLPDEDAATFAHKLANTNQEAQQCPLWATVLCTPYEPKLVTAALASINPGNYPPDNTWEQSMLLASLSHILADAPLRRIFCSIPQVEAILPPLEPRSSPLTIPHQ